MDTRLAHRTALAALNPRFGRAFDDSAASNRVAEVCSPVADVWCASVTTVRAAWWLAVTATECVAVQS